MIGKFYLTLALVCAVQLSFAQLKIGNHPTVINRASILELESGNQGLLLTRIHDTTAISSLNPPDGMLIFYINGSAKDTCLMIRKSGAWIKIADLSNINKLGFLTFESDPVWIADSSNYYPRAMSQAMFQPKGSYLLPSDTTGKWAPKGLYVSPADTAGHWAPNASYVRTADTAAMLSPYLRAASFVADTLNHWAPRGKYLFPSDTVGKWISVNDTSGRWAPKGLYLFPADTLGKWLPVGTKYLVPSDTIPLNIEILTRLKITDTAGHWAPNASYLRTADTAAMLSPYLRAANFAADTSNHWAPKGAYISPTDTSGKWVSVNDTSSRWAPKGLYLFPSDTTGHWAPNASYVRTADTATMLTPYLRTANFAADTLNHWAPRGVYLFPADTISKWLPVGTKYLVPSDTIPLNVEILARLKIADTTGRWAPKGAYLSPTDTSGKWVSVNDTSGRWAPKGLYLFPSDTTGHWAPNASYVRTADTATMLSPYLRTANFAADTSNHWAPKGLYLFPSDTLGHWAPNGSYVRTADTAAMLVPYLPKGDTTNLLATHNYVLNNQDTNHIASFWLKARSELSGTNGWLYNSTTGIGQVDSTKYATLNYVNTTVSGNAWLLNGNNNSTIKNLGNTSNYDLPFITNNIERMRITAGGNLGINQPASISEQLTVNGNAYLSGNYKMYFISDASSSRYLGSGRNGDLALISNLSGQWLRIGSNNSNISFWVDGNADFNDSPQFVLSASNSNNNSPSMGVNTSTPGANLDVNGTFKMGNNGTVLNGVFKGTITISDNTSFNYNQTETETVDISSSGQRVLPSGTALNSNATIILNPTTSLPASLGIGWVSPQSDGKDIMIGIIAGNGGALGTVTFNVTVIQ